MSELVITPVASKRELQRDAKSLDRHHCNRPDRRTDRNVNERVPFSVTGSNPADHHDQEYRNEYAIAQKPCTGASPLRSVFYPHRYLQHLFYSHDTYLVEVHSPEFHQQFEFPCRVVHAAL